MLRVAASKVLPKTFLVFLSSSLVVPAFAAGPQSFNQAKRVLKQLYSQNQTSFYCNCRYRSQGKKLIPDLDSCGYQPRKNKARASRIEWEHVMPAWAFGHQLQCWQDGGRKACRKDKRFRQMEADMHNLVPAVGEVNGDRSNYSFAQIPGEIRNYGACDVEVAFKARKVEPADYIRGDIARTYFYMSDRYGLNISQKQTQLFNSWAKSDPVDEWERERNLKIAKVQGNLNPYVSGHQKRVETQLIVKPESQNWLDKLRTLFSFD